MTNEQLKELLGQVTPGDWEIRWSICKADNDDVRHEKTRELKAGETRRNLKVGDELWRVPASIGPLGVDHNHWTGNYLTCNEAEARLMAMSKSLAEELVAVREALVETAWLIERGHTTVNHGPTYYSGYIPVLDAGWSQDCMDAIRFSRKIDADRMAERLREHWPNCRVSQHTWVNNPAQGPLGRG